MINKNRIFNICFTAILMSLTLSAYYLMNVIPLGSIGSFDIHILFYIFGIILIKEKPFKLFFFFSIPFLSIFNTNILAINYLQVFVEYFLVYYCFFIFLFFKFPKNEKLILNFSIFVICIIFSFSLRLFLHTISGIIWWGASNIFTSLLINIRMLILDWIFIVPISIMLFSSINAFSNKKYIF